MLSFYLMLLAKDQITGIEDIYVMKDAVTLPS